MFENKNIMIFGGNGSIGQEIIKQLIPLKPAVIRIYSNEENGLAELKQEYGEKQFRYLLGDIRNRERVYRALDGIDYCFNAAAYKHVDLCEYNPMDAVTTNVDGLNNIIDGCFAQGVKKLIHISTDKAVNPTCLMGATKLIGERLCMARNEHRGTNITLISCVRFGNVYGSRGSLKPVIEGQIRKGNLVTITDNRMKRYIIEPEEAGKFILSSMEMMLGGEIFVPKLKEYLIREVIEDIVHNYAIELGRIPEGIEIREVGKRQGEKLTEELMTSEEQYEAKELKDRWVING